MADDNNNANRDTKRKKGEKEVFLPKENVHRLC